MKNLSAMIIAVALLTSPALHGQVLKLGDSAKSRDEVPIEVPDPRDLRADWWKYMEAADPPLDQRVARFAESIERAVLSLSLEDVGDIVELADLAKGNLTAYAEELSKTPAPFDVTVRTSGQFTWAQLFEIPGKLRQCVSCYSGSSSADSGFAGGRCRHA